ncbi:MAG: isoleucine--tRNA ligase [Flavobacteriaceae bacterium]|nr:isoleucine--tRNA ligase [Flavobacteriaceae bacterium]|tara:strand:- start:1987 stop:5388 length:3402 start_codon:yes stop_codon:yes gene_type:complete
MVFKEYKSLDLPKISKEIMNFWERQQIFDKSISERENHPSFIFYEGPPSANGMPGIHHVMARTIKDIFCRYKTQKGFQVKRKAGWDTHGLPVEIGVEKALGITKEDIGKTISVAEYNSVCKKAVMKYTHVWNKLTQVMGYWVDMDDPYVTYTPKYMESVWWLLKQIYEKNLLYKGYTIQPYSPKAGTGLSSHELNQPGTYQEVSDTTVTAQFKTIKVSLPKALQEDVPLYFLAWTTTPWTLPSNTALTVGPKIEYVVIHTFNQYTFEPVRVVMAKVLVEKQFSGKYTAVGSLSEIERTANTNDKIPYFIEKTLLGKDLLNIRYEKLWHDAPLPVDHPENAYRVILGDFVTTEDGTGIVHTAPTFGADDAKVAKDATPEVPPMLILDENKNKVPLVDLQGKFIPAMGALAGQYVKNEYYDEGKAPEKSVDVQIAIRLKEENKAFKVEKYVHTYPNCWRTDKPILYYPMDSWFIKVTDVKERLTALNEAINWKPKSTGTGRFGNWLANANDWNLSRSRFWGIPLPVWRTEDGLSTKVVGSVAELYQAIEKSIERGLMSENPFADFVPGEMSSENYNKIDLHKHIVDDIVLADELGQPMYRENDLIDVWFDSGAMPYAQWHYPFENKEKVEGGSHFPADYIAEGVDQTRGWFYTLHAISTLIFNDLSYKNVISNGLVLDKNGQKMSKRLGNAVDPFETIERYGADATRWYMISNANPWDNLKFDTEGIGEVQRKFFGTLHNTYSFFSLYANIDGFKNEESAIPLEERFELDRWILSELNSLIGNVDAYYEDYEPTKATRAISDFVQEKLSNWYVRLSRRRFWKGEYQKDKIAAYQTLLECLIKVSQLAAPVAPFYSDQLYQNLTENTLTAKHLSVHLSLFPEVDKKAIDSVLENQINTARNITSLALSLRKKEQIKVRQPLQSLMIAVSGKKEKEQIEKIIPQVRSEINVKSIELIDDDSNILIKEIKPNFKLLGPRFGKETGRVVSIINSFGEKEIKTLEETGKINISFNEKNINLELGEVEISSKDIEGWGVAHGNGITVALDVSLTEDLIDEGIARELVNRIQNIRKEGGLAVTDRIIITFLADPSLKEKINKNNVYIRSETLAENIEFNDDLEGGNEVVFDLVKAQITIKKI